MKTSTKIWIGVLIISNVLFGVLFNYVINMFNFDNGINFNFSVQGVIGIISFLFANISGGILFSRFLKTQPFSRQLFFISAPPTITLSVLIYYAINFAKTEQIGMYSLLKETITIKNTNSSFSVYIWIAVIVLVYLAYLFIMFNILSRPIRKVERVIEDFANEKIHDNINIHGGTQFKKINDNLLKISENYIKNSEKIVKIEKEYEKYIPKQIISYFNKRDIIDLKVGDNVERELSILKCFSLNNNIFNKFNEVNKLIKKYDGFVINLSNNETNVIFEKPNNAMKIGLEIYRFFEKEFAINDVKILVDTTTVKFVVCGDSINKKIEILPNNDNIFEIMKNFIKTFKNSIIFTENTLNKIKNYKFSYRYIAKITDNAKQKNIYENLMTYPSVVREELILSKNVFEEAVKAFNDNNFNLATERFKNVLSFSKNDFVSKKYLQLCKK